MTPKTEERQKNPIAIIGRMGAILALVSILLLPIGGCGERGVTGAKLLERFNRDDGPGTYELLVVLCGTLALIGIIARPSILCLLTGGGGLATILIGYAMARHDFGRAFKLMLGGYLALLGFAALLIEGIRQATRSGVDKAADDSLRRADD